MGVITLSPSFMWLEVNYSYTYKKNSNKKSIIFLWVMALLEKSTLSSDSTYLG